MPAPYTVDAVQAIRFAAKRGQSGSEVRESLGWNTAMFDRVCSKHGITFVKASVPDAAAAKSLPDDNSLTPAKQPPCQGRSCNININEITKAKVYRCAAAENSTISRYLVNILVEALSSGTAATCSPYVGPPRSTYICCTVTPAIYEALERAMGHNRHRSVGAFVAALIDQHLRGDGKRSAQS